jgi:hypothetical protein
MGHDRTGGDGSPGVDELADRLGATDEPGLAEANGARGAANPKVTR